MIDYTQLDTMVVFFNAFLFFIGMTLGMVILKMAGALLISWWWVFSPLIPVALFVGYAVFLAYSMTNT